MKKFLEIGKIFGVKGLRGEVLIEPWCDSPEFLKKFKKLYLNDGEKELRVISARIHKSSVIILFKDIENATQAQCLVGETVFMNRDDVKLEKGRYFIQDLLGISVIDVDTGKEYGKITDVFKTGANDVYEITDSNEKKYLVPVIPDVVINLDIDKEVALIRPIRGIFDDEN